MNSGMLSVISSDIISFLNLRHLIPELQTSSHSWASDIISTLSLGHHFIPEPRTSSHPRTSYMVSIDVMTMSVICVLHLSSLSNMQNWGNIAQCPLFSVSICFVHLFPYVSNFPKAFMLKNLDPPFCSTLTPTYKNGHHKWLDYKFINY